MSDTTVKKEPSTFEKMKTVEEAKKRRLIAKVLTKVKHYAKEIQENKELCNLYLDEIVQDEKERKQIIDWINSLEDVKPDEDRMKELSREVKQECKEQKQKAEREIQHEIEKYVPQYYSMNTMTATNAANNLTYATVGATTSANVATTDYDLGLREKLKLNTADALCLSNSMQGIRVS